ncbi:hypothetical protein L1987_68339 [Smallanthus sonchifolius]|uniref:Uncharacterized protein n=1 Tax=Smallanthus sonchifolius TaxID=185202 RepID=A0ACB9B3F5_9ASTR|nr:hypothetical protein L1987_68339 [Smallanthus sonchifolius]
MIISFEVEHVPIAFLRVNKKFVLVLKQVLRRIAYLFAHILDPVVPPIFPPSPTPSVASSSTDSDDQDDQNDNVDDNQDLPPTPPEVRIPRHIGPNPTTYENSESPPS